MNVTVHAGGSIVLTPIHPVIDPDTAGENGEALDQKERLRFLGVYLEQVAQASDGRGRQSDSPRSARCPWWRGPGIRDETLLESAVAAPGASMMGQPLISDPLGDRSGISILHLPESSVPGWQQVAPRSQRALSSWRRTAFYPAGNCRSTIGNSSFWTWRPARSTVMKRSAGFAN